MLLQQPHHLTGLDVAIEHAAHHRFGPYVHTMTGNIPENPKLLVLMPEWSSGADGSVPRRWSAGGAGVRVTCHLSRSAEGLLAFHPTYTPQECH